MLVKRFNVVLAILLLSVCTINAAPSTGMDWFYKRFGVSSHNWSQIPVSDISLADYGKLLDSAKAGNARAVNALRLTLMSYLKETPSDERYDSLKSNLYDSSFLSRCIDLIPETIGVIPDDHRNYRNLLIQALQSDSNLITNSAIPEKYFRDRTIAEICVRSNGSLLQLFPTFQDDRRIVEMAVSHESANGALEFASDEFRDDYSIARLAIQASPEQYTFVSDKLAQDRRLAILTIKQDGRLLSFLPDSFKDDPDIVVIATNQNPYAIAFASESIRDKVSIIEMLVQQDGQLLQFASPRLQNDKAVVKKAILKTPSAIQYASIELKRDPEIISLAVKKDPSTKSYIDVYYRLGAREDISYIHNFVQRQKDVAQIKVTDFSYQDYERIILESFQGDMVAIQILLHTLYPVLNTDSDHPKELDAFKNVLYSEKFLKNVLTLEPDLLHFVPPTLPYMRGLVLMVIRNSSLDSLSFLPSYYRNDTRIMEAVVAKKPAYLEYGSVSVKNTRSVVWIAILKDGMALQFASERLRNDYKIVSKAVLENGLAIQFASERLRATKALMEKVVAKNGLALEYASAELQNDREIVLAAVSNDGMALRFASYVLKDDRDVVQTAFLNKRKALKYASLKLQAYFLFVQFFIK